ncbi:MAG: hypothetical protein JWL76_1413 [Thermoleophilia bacterium]|nr:hypothetical protein [Thermoleophilia bacterium]
MDFRGAISSARSNTLQAITELDRYDRASAPDSEYNRNVLGAVSSYISPGATQYGSAALDAARWERWVTVRQIRDVGTALELLDRAWWSVRPNGSMPNIDGARSALRDAVSYLDRSANRWAAPARFAAASAA